MQKKIVRKNIFSTPEKAAIFVAEEILLIFLIIYQAYKLFGLKSSLDGILFFQNQVYLQNIVWFVGSIILMLIIYFGIAVRDKFVMQIHDGFSKSIFSSSKGKVFGVDKNILALLFVEFIFAILIAFSIYIYLDPEVNIIPSTVPWFVKLIFFVFFVGIGLWIFSRTKIFRDAIYEDSIVKKKLLPAERLFPTRRITNLKTGTIRVAHKKKKQWEAKK